MKYLFYVLILCYLSSCEEVNKLIESSKDGKTITYDFGPQKRVEITQSKPKKTFRLEPLDESVNNPYLLVFIDHLKMVVRKKDTTALFAMLDHNIIVDHNNAERGIEAFKKAWKLDQPEPSPLWKLLGKQLALGGVTENEGDRYYFCIPYSQSNKAYAQFSYDFDWYHTAVCLVKESLVWIKPDEKSEKIGALSYDIVEMDPDYSPAHFTKIQTLDKSLSGYVKTADLAFTSEPHLEIVEIASEYKVVAYVTYD